MRNDRLCPNATTCNFHRAALDTADPDALALIRRYCLDPQGCRACFRSRFVRLNSANLSSEIAPDATLIRSLAGLYPPQDAAGDQVARLYARAAS